MLSRRFHSFGPFLHATRSDQRPPCAQADAPRAGAPSCLSGSSPEEPHISLLHRCRRLSLGSSRPSLRSQTRFSGLPVLCLREHAHKSSAPLRLLCLPAGSIGSSRLSPSPTSAPYWGAGRGRNPCCRKCWGPNSFPFPARFGGEGETQGPTSLYSAMPLLRHTGVAIYASCAQKRAIHLLLTWSLHFFSFSFSRLSGDGQNLKNVVEGERGGEKKSSVWSLAQSLLSPPLRVFVFRVVAVGTEQRGPFLLTPPWELSFPPRPCGWGLVLACGCMGLVYVS